MGKQIATIGYLKQLGAKNLHSLAQVDNFIKMRIGVQGLKEIVDFCNTRALATCDGSLTVADDLSLYDFKNYSYERSMAMTLGFDQGYLKGVGAWLEMHKDLFGESVLDVGCDNGVLTCFIAKLLPESHVLGVDRCTGSVKNAAELATKLNLSNVEFKHVCELKEEMFDTVVAARIFQENDVSEISNFVVSCANAGGTIVTVLRHISNNDGYHSVIRQMDKIGAKIDTQSHDEIVIPAWDAYNLPDSFQLDVFTRML